MIRRLASPLAFAAALATFTVVFFANAWVGDDAYITFRTIDNFVNGDGLRWNVFERVQTYTHPLWMLLCSIPYFFTREVFYTVILTCFAVCIATVVVFRRRLPETDRWKAVVFVLLLLASKTFMDWSSSGLENALSAFWAVLFVTELMARGNLRLRRVWLIASLAYVTRQDTILLYLPALLWVLWTNRRAVRARDILFGIAPAVLWTVFAVVYYGFPFPNTAYAKALISGVPVDSKLFQGLAYFQVATLWDPLAIVMLLVFVWRAVRGNDPHPVLFAWGAVAYIVYVIAVAASSSVMGLRFFSVPFAIAAVTTLLAADTFDGAVIAVLALVMLAGAPLSPLRTLGCHWASTNRPEGWKTSAIVDMRALACDSGNALADFQRNVTMPNHAWFKMGIAFRKSEQRVRLGGPSGLGAMGFFPYAAGPSKIVVDPYGLTDPLMARLPVITDRGWIPGEIPRQVPEGYLESLEAGTNLIANPALHDYYDSLSLVTSGPILSARRWREIAAINLGRRDHLLREYAKRGR